MNGYRSKAARALCAVFLFACPSCATKNADLRSEEPQKASPREAPKIFEELDRSNCNSAIERQIKEGFEKLKGAQSNPVRSGVFDVAFPKDSAEYLALNKMAIVAVTLFSHQADDLPAARFGFMPQAPEVKEKMQAEPAVAFPRIFPMTPVSELSAQSEIAQKLGRFRQDTYLFVPIRMLRQKGQFVVTLRSGASLPIGYFPVPVKQSFILKDKNPVEARDQLPNPKLVVKILADHYCFGFGG